MKYSNLLRFLLRWVSLPEALTKERNYQDVIDDPVYGDDFKNDLILAREEYLDYKKEVKNDL